MQYVLAHLGHTHGTCASVLWKCRRAQPAYTALKLHIAALSIHLLLVWALVGQKAAVCANIAVLCYLQDANRLARSGAGG